MKKIITVVFILMVMLNISSLYSATKTIDAGGAGDYLTFGECFTDLVTNGISEPLNVEVMSGTYVESAGLNGAIPGADADNTVHFYPVGGDVLIDGGSGEYAIGLLNTAWIYFEGFEMKLDGIFEYSNGVMLVSNSTNIDISHCELHDSGFVGLLLSESQDIRFWNNFVYDTNYANLSFASCGIGANIEVWNNSLLYNYPYFGGMMGPPAQCISLYQSSANIHNNALHKAVDDNSPMGSFGIINVELGGGLMADYYTAGSFNNNCYYTVSGNTLFQVGFMEIYTDLASLNTAYGFAANSVFGDPLYVNASVDNEDLNIESISSACFNAGAVPSRWFSDDFNYETRTRWDIGADYIVPSPFTGTITIDAGGTGDYLTFGECFTDLLLAGISGDLNVEVMSGTYVESAGLNGALPGADADNMVHFYPVGGDVLIDGGSGEYAIGLLNTAWIYFEGFEMKLDGIFEYSNGVMLVSNSTNIDISHCELHDSGFVGLLLSESQDIRFWNNFVYDTNYANLSFASCGTEANIEVWNNSLLYNYPYFGGMMGPPAQCISLYQSSANIHNNTLYKAVDDNSPMGSFGIINVELGGGLMADYYTAGSFNNNCYYTVSGNTLFQVGFMEIYTDLASLNTAYGFAANSVFGDPMYVNASVDNEDLNIESISSACFNAGAVPSRWFSDDFNYETRTRWDIGADYIDGVIPAVQNLTISITGSTVILDWDEVIVAVEYNVYSSSDPYSNFPTGWTLEGSTSNLYWSESVTSDTKFYIVTATDGL